MTTSPKYGYTDLENNAGNVTAQSLINRVHEALANLRIESDTLTSPPAHVEGNVWIPAATATGAWTGQEGKFAISIGAGWTFVAPWDGAQAWFTNVDQFRVYNGTTWVELPVSTADSITASTTQSQGQQPLTAFLNIVTTVANIDDVVTLKAAAKGARQVIFNNGANQLQVFPASGDAIDDNTADTSITMAAGTSLEFFAVDATDWYTK